MFGLSICSPVYSFVLSIDLLEYKICTALVSSCIYHNPSVNGTVNVVIFDGGKFRESSSKDISRGGNFHNTTPISLI